MYQEWDKIIDELRGTTNSTYSLGEYVENLFENNSDFTAYVDQHIFQCACCGWWCDISEECSEEYDLLEWTCGGCVSDI